MRLTSRPGRWGAASLGSAAPTCAAERAPFSPRASCKGIVRRLIRRDAGIMRGIYRGAMQVIDLLRFSRVNEKPRDKTPGAVYKDRCYSITYTLYFYTVYTNIFTGGSGGIE